MKNIFLVLAIFSFGFTFSQKPQTSLSKNYIKYGEPVVLVIKVEASAKDKIVFPYLKDSLAHNIEILERKSNHQQAGQKTIYTDSITFSSYEAGKYKIPALTIKINTQQFSTPEFELKVDSVKVDTLKQPLYDIKPIVEAPLTFTDHVKDIAEKAFGGLKYFIFALIILAIIAFVVYYFFFKKKKTKKYIENIDAIALKKIEALEKTDYIEKGQLKKYFTELAAILREYIENRWKFPASKLLSDDMINYIYEIKGWINTDDKSLLDQVFSVTDSAKFAKLKPTDKESLTYTSLSKQFIHNTKPIINTNEK